MPVDEPIKRLRAGEIPPQLRAAPAAVGELPLITRVPAVLAGRLSGPHAAFRVQKAAKLKCLSLGIYFVMIESAVNGNPLAFIGNKLPANRATPAFPPGIASLSGGVCRGLRVPNMCAVQQIPDLRADMSGSVFHFEYCSSNLGRELPIFKHCEYIHIAQRPQRL